MTGFPYAVRTPDAAETANHGSGANTLPGVRSACDTQ